MPLEVESHPQLTANEEVRTSVPQPHGILPPVSMSLEANSFPELPDESQAGHPLILALGETLNRVFNQACLDSSPTEAMR